jgi:hypothetical protein
MPLAQILKRPVWVASGKMVAGTRQFGRPVLHKWNWRTLSSSAEIAAFGPEYFDYRRGVTENTDIAGIKRLDRVWMDGEPSNPTDVLAKDADFYIVSVDPGAGGYADITFKRLSSDAA